MGYPFFLSDKSSRSRSLRCFVQAVTRLRNVAASIPAALRNYAVAMSRLCTGIRDFLHRLTRFPRLVTCNDVSNEAVEQRRDDKLPEKLRRLHPRLYVIYTRSCYISDFQTFSLPAIYLFTVSYLKYVHKYLKYEWDIIFYISNSTFR